MIHTTNRYEAKGFSVLTAAAQTNVLVTALLVYATAATLRVGLFSVAPVGFAACGGYGVGVLMTKYHWAFLSSMSVSLIGAIVVAIVISAPILRLTGVFAALATLAFLVVLDSLVSSLSITGGSLGIYGIPSADVRAALIVVLLINLVVWYVVDHTFVGRKLDATCESPVAAASMGINVPMIRLAAMAYAAVLSSIAGGLYAHSFYVMSPGGFGFSLAISVAALAVISGAGHWLMPLVSTFTVGLIPIAFQQLDNWGFIIQGALMTLVVIVYPDGLAGIVRRLLLPRRAFLVRPAIGLGTRLTVWL